MNYLKSSKIYTYTHISEHPGKIMILKSVHCQNSFFTIKIKNQALKIVFHLYSSFVITDFS